MKYINLQILLSRRDIKLSRRYGVLRFRMQYRRRRRLSDDGRMVVDPHIKPITY